MKISLGLIVRNEGATLEKCLQSARPFVEHIVIGLAGKSTDNTPEIARKYADEVFDIEWHNDFAEARNAVLERQLSCDPTHIMWLDGDDELIGGEKLRRIMEMRPRIGAFHAYYDYSRDQSGATNCLLIRERVLDASLGWRWGGRIHEYLVAEVPHESFLMEDVLVVHHGENKVRGKRNLEFLYRELEESEPEPPQRLLHYLGTEEALKGSYDKAILHLQRYLARAEWSEEKYLTTHLMADIYRRMGDLNKAVGMEMAAIRIKPDWPDAYFGLAEIAFHRGEWLSCVEWTATGFARPVPKTALIINPRDYDFNPLLAASIAFTNLGRFDEALGNLKQAYQISPSESVRQQMLQLTAHLKTEKVLSSYLHVIETLARNDEWLKARSIFSLCPKSIETHPRVRELWGKVQQMTAHVEDPSLMADHYINNPSWEPMAEEMVLSEAWGNHPRLMYAKKVARDLEATNIVDLGCSDGFMALPLAKLGYKVDGIDLDPRCIDIATDRAERWGLKELTSFTQGDISSVAEWAECEQFYKYDLAILFETIEHVVDPPALLDTVEKVADHVAITTPYLAWDLGEVEDWEKVELKGHLRIFDLVDIEQLLSPRGRISNLYRQPYGDSSWIFADYKPGDRPSGRRITFLAPPALEPWGPQKLAREGLGGSETAVIELARAFSDNGCRVTVFNQPDSPGYYDGVRYRDIEFFEPGVQSDLLIAWRYPEAADLSCVTKKLVLWMHDTDLGDRLTEERAAAFYSIVVQTEWHKQHMMKKYPFLQDVGFDVIGNGVDFEKFMRVEERNSLRVVYASSPDRGLDVILEHIWPKILEKVPNAELHYYYGWNNIDLASSGNKSLPEFKRRVGELTLQTRNVVNHGRVTQGELAKELLRSSVWLYPTYFSETYCITAIEAQLAGLVPVTNDLAALGETVKAGRIIPGDVMDPAVQSRYADEVIKLLIDGVDPDERSTIRAKVPAFSWAQRATTWLSSFK